MKKILFALMILFYFNMLFFAETNKQSIDLIDWNKSKESIINDLKQNGWELEIDEFNCVKGNNPNKTITFCGIEVKYILFFF